MENIRARLDLTFHDTLHQVRSRNGGWRGIKALSPVIPRNSEGFISPIGSDDPTWPERSPYVVSLMELIQNYGHSPIRRRLLIGLLDYRAELHHAGLSRGFQWINGSFLENIEANESRDPRDIDVVTFFDLPDEYTTEETLIRDHPSIFDWAFIRSRFGVDAYYVVLNAEHIDEVVKGSTYWYSLWSHTRDGRWKGYLQVDLADNEDETVRTEIGESMEERG